MFIHSSYYFVYWFWRVGLSAPSKVSGNFCELNDSVTEWIWRRRIEALERARARARPQKARMSCTFITRHSRRVFIILPWPVTAVTMARGIMNFQMGRCACVRVLVHLASACVWLALIANTENSCDRMCASYGQNVNVYSFDDCHFYISCRSLFLEPLFNAT